MKNLINTAIKKRWLMLALFVLLAFFGYYSWKQLSIEAYPDIADVTSQVVTQVQGLAAEEVEKQITIPLERAINGLPGMHVMRSRSIFGLSLITVVFQDGVEDYWARMRIQERINNVDLPYGANPTLDPLTSPIGEIYRYIIESKDHDLRALTDLQNWVIIPRLKQVSGVVDVANFGGITTQYQIEIDPHKLEQYEIGLADVTQAIENNNANAGGSVLPQGDQGFVIRGIGLVNNLQTLGNIVVKSIKGVPIFVKDLGVLKLGILERKGALGYTDRSVNYSDGIQGIVIMLKHQNPSLVLDGVHAAIEDLNKNLLPKGVSVRSYIDRTSLVNTTLETVSHTLLEGMGLVIVVLIIFLGNWRGALLVAITVPVALLIAFILMKLTNIPANLLSLGAIDFGIIVDGAIVMMETILKKREDEPNLEFQEISIGKMAAEVARPIFFSTIIIITAYIPLFAFERVEKKLFTPMAFTVGYALLGALAAALLLIPGLAYAIYHRPRKMYHNKWLEKLTDAYHLRIQKIISKPKSVFAPLLIILVGTIILTGTVGKDFLPELDEGSIWMPVQLPPGLTLEKSKEMSDTFRSVIMKYPEVTYVMVQAGRNDEGTDYFTPSHFEASVGLKPYREWKNGRRKSDLINDLAKEFQKRPGYLVGFTQPMIDGVMDKIAGAHTGIVLKVFGKDLTEARRIGE
ncbi:MAG TPA: efflux RND transporter permease subunit, partial [Bacteroidia bacterium]|nr:efflux RND transporter permease subunit [Bacteroidia bacterium]